MLQRVWELPQTLWETTWTLQYKPAPSLHDEDRSIGMTIPTRMSSWMAMTAKNNQSTLSFSVVYLF